MMLLLIDVGNSCLKWALANGTMVQPMHRVSHQNRQLAALFHEQWAELQPPHRVVLANVAGAALAATLAQWVKHAWDVALEPVRVEDEALGVRNAYQDPARLGVDRWVGLIAARQLIPGAVCVIDCGSAITVDAMDAEGNHLGGLIMPGLAMMQKSLTTETQGIGAVTQDMPAGLLAQDTQAGVLAGSRWAALGFIRGVVAQLKHDLGEPLTVVVTGGDAPMLLPQLPDDYRHEPDWIMKGLAILAGENA
jgi:type III pantothenate kinase